MDDALQLAADIVKPEEGLELRAYVDSLAYSKPVTIGYGSTHWWDGGPVPPDAVLDSEEEATELMMLELAPVALRIYNAAPQGITNGQLGALTSFAYNVGMGALLGSTLWRYHKAGEYDEAAAQFDRWNKAGGVVRRGLVRRRKRERELYEAGIPGGEVL